jgi:Na+(H+)/acetate symporter ActP
MTKPRCFFPFVILTLIHFCLSSRGALAAVLAGLITNTSTSHVYYLLSQNTWTASEAEAIRLGGHLATIDDTVENHWIYTNFSNFGGQPPALWIGLQAGQSLAVLPG